MTAIQLAKPADAEAIAAFANGSFTHTFGHIYNPADLSAFLADWKPPERVCAQIASDDYDIGLVRGSAGALTGTLKIGPRVFEIPPGPAAARPVEPHDRKRGV